MCDKDASKLIQQAFYYSVLVQRSHTVIILLAYNKYNYTISRVTHCYYVKLSNKHLTLIRMNVYIRSRILVSPNMSMHRSFYHLLH